MDPGVPAFEYENTCLDGRYRIVKRIIADPRRDVLLQSVKWQSLSDARDDYRLFALLTPHLANAGRNNSAWVADYKGVPMLLAEGRGTALALASANPWRSASAGFVGVSDGWQALPRTGTLPAWQRAENGNVALTGEIPLRDGAAVTLALGFGRNAEEAAQRARASLHDGFEDDRLRGGAHRVYWRLASRDEDRAARHGARQKPGRRESTRQGQRRSACRERPNEDPPSQRLARASHHTSVAVMLTHEPTSVPGAIGVRYTAGCGAPLPHRARRRTVRVLALQPQVSPHAGRKAPAHRTGCCCRGALEHRRLGSFRDTGTQDSGVGMHYAELDVAGVAAGTNVVFTILWMAGQRWEGTNYSVEVGLRSDA